MTTGPDGQHPWQHERAELRERTRVYKDDQGHTWPETAAHFDRSVGTVKYRVYRARKEREEEAEAKVQPSLPLDDPAQQAFELDGE